MLDSVRSRWPWAMAILLTVSVVCFTKIRTMPFLYEATCKIEFSSPTQEGSLDSRNLWRYSSFILQNLYLSSQRIIITSDPIISKVVDDLGITNEGLTEDALERKKKSIAGSLSIKRIPDSQIFMISSRGTNPAQARDYANSTAASYIRYTYEKKLDNYRRSISWLDEELIALKEKLNQAQRRLVEFIEKENFSGVVDNASAVEGSSVDNRYGEISGLLERLQARKVEEELKLLRLKQKYLPAHPAYKAVDAEIKLLNVKMAEQETRLSDLREQNESRVIRKKKNEIEYSILSREVEINKEIYNALIRKHKETDIGSAVARTDATVIEYAKLPSYPVGPNKRFLYILSLILGFVFSVGYCFLMEYVDTSLRDANDIETHLGAPLLAVIQKGDPAATIRDLHMVVSEDDPDIAEPYRILRINLNFSFPREKKARVMMVGSTEKGEGKSTVALNLAMVTAELGRKTLLIDGDLRARKATRFFEQEHHFGLTSYLIGDRTLDQVINRTNTENLDFLPAGAIPPKPSTLLESKAMQQLLNTLQHEYDEIIIDAPPVNVVIDSSIIASMVDGVIMVVESGRTSRYHVKKALEQLEKVQAQLSGIVLNKVDIGSKKYYYPYGAQYYAYGERRPKARTEESTPAKKLTAV